MVELGGSMSKSPNWVGLWLNWVGPCPSWVGQCPIWVGQCPNWVDLFPNWLYQYPSWVDQCPNRLGQFPNWVDQCSNWVDQCPPLLLVPVQYEWLKNAKTADSMLLAAVNFFFFDQIISSPTILLALGNTHCVQNHFEVVC